MSFSADDVRDAQWIERAMISKCNALIGDITSGAHQLCTLRSRENCSVSSSLSNSLSRGSKGLTPPQNGQLPTKAPSRGTAFLKVIHDANQRAAKHKTLAAGAVASVKEP
eukprot:912972-Amphidinium_carterae.2